MLDGTTYMGTIDGGLTDEVTGRGLCTGLGAIYSRGYPWDFNKL